MNHEEPDQVPLMGLIMDPATVSKINGAKMTDFVSLLKKPVLKDVIKILLNWNWFWDRTYYGNFSGAVEAAAELGYDANWVIYTLMRLTRDPETDPQRQEHSPGNPCHADGGCLQNAPRSGAGAGHAALQ